MAPKRIILRGPDPVRVDKFVAAAGSAIKPGHLVEQSAAGEVQEHSTAGGNAESAFALPQDWVEPSSGLNIDNAYAVGDTVFVGFFAPGTLVYAFLDNGQNVAAGAYLESAGNGNLQAAGTAAATGDTRIVPAVAEEAVNATGGTSRIRVRVI